MCAQGPRRRVRCQGFGALWAQGCTWAGQGDKALAAYAYLDHKGPNLVYKSDANRTPAYDFGDQYTTIILRSLFRLNPKVI